LNINSNNEEFEKFGYTLIRDPIEGHLGPLSGILASLNWANHIQKEWVMTLPCDTPFLPKNLIESMVKTKKRKPRY